MELLTIVSVACSIPDGGSVVIFTNNKMLRSLNNLREIKDGANYPELKKLFLEQKKRLRRVDVVWRKKDGENIMFNSVTDHAEQVFEELCSKCNIEDKKTLNISSMARITRNKAAEILGVSRQTISNYIKEGILGSYVGEHGILYVNSEDIEKYAQKYKMIAANEKMINEKLKEVEYRKRAINVELTELRDRATANGKLAANAVGMLFGVINTMSHLGVLPNLTYRESSLLKDIINGMTYDELSIKYGVSATRIRQIAEKTCNKLTYNENIVIAELSTNRTLQYEVERLKKVIKSLQVSFDEYRRAKGDKPVSSAVLPPLILSRDINDCGFSVRILNALKTLDVYTVGDLVRNLRGRSDLMKVRNLGRKSVWAILDFVEENNLDFKENGESEEDFYIRLNNKLSNQKRLSIFFF